VSSAAALAKSRWLPAVLGIASIAAIVGMVETLIRLGLINRFIVPMPSEIFLAFPRIVVEENVLSRFLLTISEAFSACCCIATCCCDRRPRPGWPPSRRRRWC
jgi:NitT/TauT family transport system permease protein